MFIHAPVRHYIKAAKWSRNGPWHTAQSCQDMEQHLNTDHKSFVMLGSGEFGEQVQIVNLFSNDSLSNSLIVVVVRQDTL